MVSPLFCPCCCSYSDGFFCTIQTPSVFDPHGPTSHTPQTLDSVSNIQFSGSGSAARKHPRSGSSSTVPDDELSCHNSHDKVGSQTPQNGHGNEQALCLSSAMTHSAKRHRSNNNWPLTRSEGPEAISPHAPASANGKGRQLRHSNSSRYLVTVNGKAGKNYYRLSPSPRPASRRAAEARNNQVRRSRFIEETMSDSVSRKPPSIFMRDHGRSGKSADDKFGIFRFGKTIASAFNPFGSSWGSVSDLWKNSSEQNSNSGGNNNNTNYVNSEADDLKLRAEKAYEELKRSGYKGTVKGKYLQSVGAGASSSTSASTDADEKIAQQTWKAIQDMMDYNDGTSTATASNKQPGGYMRQTSSGPSQSQAGRYPSANKEVIAHPQLSSGRLDRMSSLRSSVPDLRRAKSALSSVSAIKRQDAWTSSQLQAPRTSIEEGDNAADTQVRKQKSRKDLLKQAKLLKQVSNLEEKLDKARRELRNLQGGDELPTEPIVPYVPKSYNRRFVPGCLPAVSSDRFSGLRSNESDGDSDNAEIPSVPRIVWSPEGVPKQPPVKRQVLRSTSGNLLRTLDVEDAKNIIKPHPSSSNKRKSSNPEPIPTSPTAFSGYQNGQNCIPTTPDSRANQVRKSKLPKNRTEDSPGSVERKQSRQHQSRSPSSSRRQSPGLRNRNTPMLRTRGDMPDLRSANANSGNRKNSSSQKIELHQQQFANDQLDHASNAEIDDEYDYEREFMKYDDDIPPVPPLPKELIEAAKNAKRDSFLARLVEKENNRRNYNKKPKSGLEKASVATDLGKENFEWPEDVF